MARAQVRIFDTHSSSTDTQGSPDVFVNGRSVHRRTDSDTCGSQVQASTTVFANGLGRARVGDTNSCGEPEVTGSPNVFIE